ncbi:unnamed protein product [Effrenium voratum]|nr:unnamed protein product [Effrenium voratum]
MSFEEAIAGKLQATRELLARAELVRAEVAKAEACAQLGRQKAEEVDAKMTAEEAQEAREALDKLFQNMGVSQKEPRAAPAAPLPPLAPQVEATMRSTALCTRRMVEIARLAESEQLIEPGAALESAMAPIPESDELLQSLLQQKLDES